MKKSTRFMVALVSGLGASATVFASPVFHHRPAGTDLQRIRNDVHRVGKTMHKVIRREHEQQSKAQ